MKKSTKRIIAGLALVLTPGSGLLLGGYIVYRGVRKLLENKNESGISTGRTEDIGSDKSVIQELRESVSKGKDRDDGSSND